jgi:hypothetical protein
MRKLQKSSNLQRSVTYLQRSKLIDPKTAVHNAAIISVLATSGCTGGSLLAVCGVWVDIAIMSAERTRTQECVPTCDLQEGNPRTQQVTEAAVMQKEFAGDSTGVSREDVLLELPNT